MPARAKTWCLEAGCGELVERGRCPRHAAERERQRGSAASRGYDARWARASRAFRLRHPLCACGCNRPSEVVDHIVPVSLGGAMWDPANWQALAKSCHDRKTAREDGGFGNAPASAGRGP